MNWTKGDIGYHKSTMSRLVVSDIGHNSHNMGKLFVTLADGKKDMYAPEEVWTEQEWEQRNANMVGTVRHNQDDDPRGIY